MNIDTEQRLGILIPDGKNINPEVIKHLGNKGIKLGEARRNGIFHGVFENFLGRWTQLPSANIIEEIAQGKFFQAGYVGSDFWSEYKAFLPEDIPPTVEELQRFPLFPENVRVSLLVRNLQADDSYYFDGEMYDDSVYKPSELRDRRLLTRYPELTRKFLRPYFPESDTVPVDIDTRIGGKEEGMVAAHAADATVVIVESGETMRRNGLRELAVIEPDIQPVFVINRAAIYDQGKEHLLKEISDRLQNGKKGSSRWEQPFQAAASAISAVTTTGSSALIVAVGIVAPFMMMGMRRK